MQNEVVTTTQTPYSIWDDALALYAQQRPSQEEIRTMSINPDDISDVLHFKSINPQGEDRLKLNMGDYGEAVTAIRTIYTTAQNLYSNVFIDDKIILTGQNGYLLKNALIFALFNGSKESIKQMMYRKEIDPFWLMRTINVRGININAMLEYLTGENWLEGDERWQKDNPLNSIAIAKFLFQFGRALDGQLSDVPFEVNNSITESINKQFPALIAKMQSGSLLDRLRGINSISSHYKLVEGVSGFKTRIYTGEPIDRFVVKIDSGEYIGKIGLVTRQFIKGDINIVAIQIYNTQTGKFDEIFMDLSDTTSFSLLKAPEISAIPKDLRTLFSKVFNLNKYQDVPEYLLIKPAQKVEEA